MKRDLWIGVKQAALIMRASRSTVLRLVQAKRLHHRVVGRQGCVEVLYHQVVAEAQARYLKES